MTRKKTATDHVTMGGTGVRCLNCGTEQAVPYPCSIAVLEGVGKGFTKDHRGCKPSAAGRARYEYKTPQEWIKSWDTGMSSLTIYSVFTGTHLRDSPGVPSDGADFGRCYRLLKVAPPEWRAELQRVADRFPEWETLVARWADLEALYLEEHPTGQAPKLYALLRELNT